MEQSQCPHSPLCGWPCKYRRKATSRSIRYRWRAGSDKPCDFSVYYMDYLRRSGRWRGDALPERRERPPLDQLLQHRGIEAPQIVDRHRERLRTCVYATEHNAVTEYQIPTRHVTLAAHRPEYRADTKRGQTANCCKCGRIRTRGFPHAILLSIKRSPTSSSTHITQP